MGFDSIQSDWLWEIQNFGLMQWLLVLCIDLNDCKVIIYAKDSIQQNYV